ncbi:hypothetical protein [Pseudomonas sp. R16(2017)]|uniref:hypothetical protein n=1 Tax=Pseudomonas sp. R16(2017) TaxID=1981704 RepID=UPI00111BDD2C|nr:hypothetical protein [Pseudomonas sp. R16(2017)]
MEYLIYIISSEPPPPDLWTIGTAICSAIIALVAVAFTWQQNKRADKHNRLMVTPHLATLTTINNEERTLLLHIENNGIGPAIIRDYTIHIDNNPITGDDEVEESLKILLKDLPNSDFGHEAITRNSFLPPGKKIELATIVTQRISPEELTKSLSQRVRITIKYESIYGELHTLDSED